MANPSKYRSVFIIISDRIKETKGRRISSSKWEVQAGLPQHTEILDNADVYCSRREAEKWLIDILLERVSFLLEKIQKLNNAESEKIS